MKKIIYLLLLLLIPVKVLAEETIEQNNRKYQFYYLEKEYSEKFYEKGKNDPKYPKIGKTWYYEDFIKASYTKPSKEEYLVEEVPVLRYQEHKKIQYIILDQTFSNTKINIMEIEVFSKEKKIPYSITCSTCAKEFTTLVQDGTIDYQYNYIENNTKIIIDLKDQYFPNDITIKFHLNGVFGKKAQIRVTVNNTNNVNDAYIRYNIDEQLNTYILTSKNLNEVEHEERLEEEILEIKGKETLENCKILERLTEYRYRSKVYQYYKETKHYVEGYYKNLPGLIKDEKKFIEEQDEKDVQVITEYIEKEVPIEKIIPEYIEKKVPVKQYIKMPIITEKIQYQDKIIEIPIEKEKIIEKSISKKQKENYPFQYLNYLITAIVLKKMSFFKG